MIKKIEENKKNCKFLEGERHREWRRGKKVQRYKTKGWHRLLLQVSHVMLQRRTEEETRSAIYWIQVQRFDKSCYINVCRV
jgi:hypothetical protein